LARSALSIPFEFPPFALSGRVYGALLNHRTALEAIGGAASRPPYNGLPKGSVLFIKPRNTLALSGEPIEVPAGEDELEVAAMLGLVIGRTACGVAESRAHEHIAGYLIVSDVSVPHPNYYRPAVRYKARDGFCPLGPKVAAPHEVGNPDKLAIHTYIDGALIQTTSTSQLIRPSARLLADVTEFMTLAPGDILALGAAAPAPRARAAQTVTIEIDGIGRIENPLVPEHA
jgi:5-oxopent-3-ene-1,2,5-tricarboxylate decarboxylase / 2-hydroxyhepta-2,4-diene-1,7-dioate isomerase